MPRNRMLFALSTCLLFLLTLSQNVSANEKTAIAILSSASQSTVIGTFRMAQQGQNALLALNLRGLDASQMISVHIHLYGDISTGDGSACGGHFNPLDAPHGNGTSRVVSSGWPDANGNGVIPLSNRVHAGDLGNFQADADGFLNVMLNSSLLSLDYDSPGFALGRCLIVNAERDNGTNPPQGQRLAQGVIAWQLGGTTFGSSVFPVRTPNEVKSAISVLAPTNESPVRGIIVFHQENASRPVTVMINLFGLPPSSSHAVQVYRYGDLSQPQQNSLTNGGVFNPYETANTCGNDANGNVQMSAGHLGNVQSDDNGNVAVNLTSNLVSLYLGTQSFMIGRGLAIMSGEYDCRTATTIGEGQPLAQGVIGYRDRTRPIPITLDPRAYMATVQASVSHSTITIPNADIRQASNGNNRGGNMNGGITVPVTTVVLRSNDGQSNTLPTFSPTQGRSGNNPFSSSPTSGNSSRPSNTSSSNNNSIWRGPAPIRNGTFQTTNSTSSSPGNNNSVSVSVSNSSSSPDKSNSSFIPYRRLPGTSVPPSRDATADVSRPTSGISRFQPIGTHTILYVLIVTFFHLM